MQSIWEATNKQVFRKPLDADCTADVAVIGAGRAGILTAYHLQKKGFRVVVLEQKRVGYGASKMPLAKITSQHGLIYYKLLKNCGREQAMQFAWSNQKAIRQYKDLIDEHNIDCNFEWKDAYTYTLDDTDRIHKEVQAAQSLGIDASFVRDCGLPLPIKGAVRFSKQAQFHPLKFINPIADMLTIYENTQVQKINGTTLFTDRGQVTANYIVMANHYPLSGNAGHYAMRMHQRRTYVLALENAQNLDGMYIDADEQGHSFRQYKNTLLFAGGTHRSGIPQKEDAFEALRKKAKMLYPESWEVHRWSGQDCTTADGVPFIGQYAPNHPNWYVATGFNQWGMTTAMVAAKVLTDLISSSSSIYEEVYAPKRLALKASASNLVHDTAIFTTSMLKSKFHTSDLTAFDIPRNRGAVIQYGGEKVGAYRDENGKLYLVSVTCPHLGCQLEFNRTDKSWDCPCHGSRFDYQGNLLDNPATQGIQLKRYD